MLLSHWVDDKNGDFCMTMKFSHILILCFSYFLFIEQRLYDLYLLFFYSSSMSSSAICTAFVAAPLRT